jgi:putative peptide zinc metalloprotease protein
VEAPTGTASSAVLTPVRAAAAGAGPAPSGVPSGVPPTAATSASPTGGWRLAPGLELQGRVEGSGLRTESYLVRRADGQTIQVSELVQIVLDTVRPDRTAGEVADRVSDAYGRRLSEDGLVHLVTTRLEPLGLLVPVGPTDAGMAPPEGGADADPSPPAPRARPLLSLSLRGVLLPARGVQAVSGVLRPLYRTPVVVAVLAAALAVDVLLLREGDAGAALGQVLTSPAALLGLWCVLTAAGLFHEVGHATACRYGGATPGAIGFGVYLLFPAFYTDVTDSYRLPRAGRLRVDLGGLYFNAIAVVVLGLVQLQSGSGLLLLAVLVMHLQMAEQLVPAVRLDGYYALADLAGVPDLFARVGPVLRSLRPGAPTDPRVAELRPRARRVVVTWVVVVTPLLLVSAGWLLWHLPAIVQQSVLAVRAQAEQLSRAVATGDWVSTAITVIALVLLAVPLLGIGALLWRLVGLAGQLIRRLVRGRPAPADTAHVSRHAPKEQAMTDLQDRTERPPSAGDFTDELMLPTAVPVPTIGWRRAVYRASGSAVNLGPGPRERRRAELEERLRAPVTGSRRVVVMSRKGGVGKTTMSFALGSTFASIRGDRVIAVDANPDAGNLAHRVSRPNDLTITDVLGGIDEIHTYAQLRAYTSQSTESRLEVLASDDDPRIGMALDRGDYHHLIGLLDRFYNLIVLDTGTGILDSANQGLLAEADQIVLVSRPGIDGGRAAALTLDWLDEHDHADLVRGAVVVINAVRPGVGAPLGPIVAHFEQRCGRVVTVPWDPALETGAQTSLASLRPATRDGLVEVAAAVADGFADERPRR